MPHLSSSGVRQFSLVNGPTSSNAYVTAMLSVGECKGSLPQFSLCDAERHAAHGRLMWDADHVANGSESPFFSVAPVRLEVKASGECRLAVGTADFVTLAVLPFRWIDKVQIAAAVAQTGAAARAIRWDLIDVVLSYGDGHSEKLESTCLPSVVSGGRVRRASHLAAEVNEPVAAQFAEMSTGSREVVGLKLRGQVTLRANEGLPRGIALRPDELLGQVSVFTDGSDGCG
jgi:hypothetical protein